MNLMCSRCKKRMAVIFLTKMDGSNNISNEGLCLKCAKELGVQPINEMMEKMGLTDEAIDAMDDQLDQLGENAFEMGGAQSMPPFFQQLFSKPEDGEKGEIAAKDSALEPQPQQPARSQDSQPQGDFAPSREEGRKPRRSRRKYLDNFCENLTAKAKEGRLDNIIGRDRETERLLQILGRRTKNNPCLIGEPGVGKTAIVEGLALRIAQGNVPARLQEKEVFLLDLAALVAGTQFRGQFESRVKGLVDEVKREGNIILFIDEVHNLVGAGDSEGSMNAANILKPALSRGELQVIGATTFAEYRKYIEKDAALERRFQPVTVEEPTVADTIQVLKGIRKYYEQFHRVLLPDETVEMCARLSERYITDRFLPDKAIDLMDEACSYATLKNQTLAEYDAVQGRLMRLTDQIQEAQSQSEVDYEKLARMKAEQLRCEGREEELRRNAVDCPVTLDEVAAVSEVGLGMVAGKIHQSEMKRMANLEQVLKKRVIGQDEAISLVAKAVRRSRVQLSSRRRPASFIFVGPTGVGKTELVKTLSEELFDSTEPLIRLDMSEYMEKHTVSKLIGSPPGYIGYDEAGQLTEKIRRRPYSVVLFDEIEKAHPDVMNILLQILDEGRITDSQGRRVSFENALIVMTSNAGSERKEGSLGFAKTADQAAREKSIKALSEFLRPEFLGRVDEIVPFRALDENDYVQIAGLLLDELKEPMEEKGIAFGYDAAATALIAKKAFADKSSGARSLRRVIRREVEDPLAMLLVERGEDMPGAVKVLAKEDRLELATL